MNPTLTETLTQIADDFDLDAGDLLRYAAEDTQTGWDAGEGAWPIGSLWQVEGQILYALVRALKPTRLLELGTWHGCSATHMLLAMARNDNQASLIGVDNDKHQTGVIGGKIPPRLRSDITIINSHISGFIVNQSDTFDFVFSDGSHDSEAVAIIWLARKKLLNPGGVMIEHDALHFGVGEQVMRGIHQSDALPFTYITEPSDCGLAIERMPLEEVKDYAAMGYNELWTETGPQELDIRDWMKDEMEVPKAARRKWKPKKPELLALVLKWTGDGDRTFNHPPVTVTEQLESAQLEGEKKASRIKNGGS